MIWLIGGYMWLYVHRPFEIWPGVLGPLQVERVYMILMLLYWGVVAPKKWLPNGLHVALIALFCVLAASYLFSSYQAQLPEGLEMYAKVMVFYFLLVTTVREEKDLERLVLLYLVAVGLYMFHSLLEYCNGRYEFRMGIRRMNGVDVTYGNPNNFASSLVISLPLTLPVWASRPGWLTRLLLWGFSLGVCICVVLTGSRAGLVGLAVCVPLCLLGLGLRVGAAVVVCGGALVAAVAMPDDLKNRFLTLLDSSYGPQNAASSAMGRMSGLVNGYDAFLRSPLLGHGPNSFPLATGCGFQAHNVYGQLLCELGGLGVLAFGALLFYFVRNAVLVRRCYARGRPRDFTFYTMRGLGISVFMLCLLGWSGHNLYRYNWQWFAAFQIIAVYCVCNKRALPVTARPMVPGTWQPRPRLRLAPGT
jgi:hypothetical protein